MTHPSLDLLPAGAFAGPDSAPQLGEPRSALLQGPGDQPCQISPLALKVLPLTWRITSCLLTSCPSASCSPLSSGCGPVSFPAAVFLSLTTAVVQESLHSQNTPYSSVPTIVLHLHLQNHFLCLLPLFDGETVGPLFPQHLIEE